LLKDTPAEETAMATRKIADTEEPWEDGSLGREAKYVARAPLAAENDLDEALGLNRDPSGCRGNSSTSSSSSLTSMAWATSR
jgi:hypothetical protein